jgi:chromosome condensin MukBEF ATPase and DNA-binding subunit MukB
METSKDTICDLRNRKRASSQVFTFAFTEQGVAMLSAVLNSQRAIQASIQIMRAFVLMRQCALEYQDLQEKLTDLEKRFGQKFTDIEQVLNYLIQKDQKQVQQEELGKLVGVQKAQISKIENSIKNARLDTIIKIFKALGATIKFNVELDYQQFAY